MKVALLSSTEFGLKCLKEAVLPLPEITVNGVLTTPPSIEISYSDEPIEIATHADFRSVEARISGSIRSESRMNETIYREVLEAWSPDLVLALGWYYLLADAFRHRIPRGCLGIHASLLPRFRGGAPIPWAIIEGEDETGVSLFYLEDGVDTGDVVGQRRFPIADVDTCADVYEKATTASIELLETYLPRLADGSAPRIPQNESRASRYPQRSPEDGRIEWNRPACRIYDFIRAQTHPYPGAYTILENREITIWKATKKSEPHDLPAGELAVDRNGDGLTVLVGTATSPLVLEEITWREDPPDAPPILDYLNVRSATDDELRFE